MAKPKAPQYQAGLFLRSSLQDCVGDSRRRRPGNGRVRPADRNGALGGVRWSKEATIDLNQSPA
jgi:hypothetical protein